MPAPDFATLYDFETQMNDAVVSAILAFFAAEGITCPVYTVRDSDTEASPRVEVNFAPGSSLGQWCAVGQANPKQVPCSFDGTLTVAIVTTRPVQTGNNAIHGTMRGLVRYVLSAAARGFTLDYLQILEMLPSGSASELFEEKQQDITELTYSVKFGILQGAWPSDAPSGSPWSSAFSSAFG